MVKLDATVNGDEVEYVVTSVDPDIRETFRGEQYFLKAWGRAASIESEKRLNRILAEGEAEAKNLRKLVAMLFDGFDVSITSFDSPSLDYSYSNKDETFRRSGFSSVESLVQDVIRSDPDLKG